MKIHTMIFVGSAVARNDIPKVDSLCKGTLRRHPRDLFALEVLADIYWRNGKLEQAMPFALQTLESAPNDFRALRVVAHAYAARGDDDAAYRYAKRLCSADSPSLPPCKEIAWFLKPFSWIPRVRHVRHKAIAHLNKKQASCRKWAQWARDYVANYESQSKTAQEGNP
jgi:tetratricopeptide (TPR) repeat protein